MVTIKKRIYMLDKRKDTVSQIKKDEHVDSYREKIAELVRQIEDEKFLRRIYIIISDNAKEKPE